MNNEITLKCRCGKVQGCAHNITAKSGTRVVCYCRDCQAFIHTLGREEDVLDEHGGTDLFQITPAQINIIQGIKELRCLRLTPKGPIRWYTECCKTPVANSVSINMPLVGILHSFMPLEDKRNEILGPVVFYIQGQEANGTPAVEPLYPGFPLLKLIAYYVPRLLLAKLRRQNKPNPFFKLNGKPISKPRMLTNKNEKLI